MMSTSPMAASVRQLAERALSRAAGAPLIAGNAVKILRDSTENYPAWLQAIAGAKKWVHFESYIFRDDEVGREFAEALAAKAREGVRVRVIYDWLGGSSRRLARSMAEAGVAVRRFNPPRLDSPLGWLSRDHRKMVGVDGEIGFVSGLCVSAKWVGNPARGIEPWRDTGVELRGPAVADVERAFADVWAVAGTPLAADEVPEAGSIPPAGDLHVRVIATVPSLGGLFRLDQLVASMARRRLWLTDAYFVGLASYVSALQAAAQDGVDVRLLVPGSSDVPVVRAVSTAGYRSLLESGIRVFEWNGTMLHAKTAVADGRWARVGSTNLNVASWIGNYELDLAVEDEGFGRAMEALYEQDLTNATEIVLRGGRRLAAVEKRPLRLGRGGSAGRVAAGALRIGNAVEAAMTNRRFLGPAEARMMAVVGSILVAVAVVGLLWPPLMAVPVALLGGWVGISLLVRAARVRQKRGGALAERPPVAVESEAGSDLPKP
jgi:cardiolipin synthase